MKAEITAGQVSDYIGYDDVMDDDLPPPKVLIADKGSGLPEKQEQPCFRIETEGLRRAALGAHGPSDAVPVIRLEECSHGSASTYVLTTGHLRSITLSRASTVLPQCFHSLIRNGHA